MPQTNRRRRLSDSSESEILELLRQRPATVTALAKALDISGTAVRKQLARLSEEGLVRETGRRHGKGRPAATYGLTEAGEASFHSNRGQVLESVLAAMHANAGSDGEKMSATLREAGARLARRMMDGPERPDGDDDPLETVLALLEELGGREGLRQAGSETEIIGFRCPLSEYSHRYPGACHFVAGFAEEVLGVPVEDRCPQTDEPVCVLAVSPAGAVPVG